MSEFRKQFILSQDGQHRWRWSLYEDGMVRVATAGVGYRTYEECLENARKIAGIASEADVWDAARQQWHDGPAVDLRLAAAG